MAHGVDVQHIDCDAFVTVLSRLVIVGFSERA